MDIYYKMWMEWRLTKKFCYQDISWSRKFVGLNIKNQFWQQKQQNGSFTNMNVRSCPQTRPDVGMRHLLVRAGSLVYCIPKWTKLSIFMVKTSSNFMVKHLSLWSKFPFLLLFVVKTDFLMFRPTNFLDHEIFW